VVLVVNDQEWSARSLESILGPNGYAVLRAYTGRQALELARRAQPDAVILDIRLPDIDGLDVCAQLRDDPRSSPGMPVIVTASGSPARAQRLAALRAGAWEFLSQPLDGEVLLLKLQSYMKAKRAMDRLSDDSLVDQTTGLYNLRGLARRAREIGAEAARRHESLACVALALDVEPAADSDDQSEEVTARLVEHLGAVCRRSGRLSDAIGRLGQAEFGIIAPATEATGAVRLVERLRASLESEPVDVHGVEQPLKIRAGYCAVADFSESAVDAVEMLLRATTALRHVREERTSGHHIRAFEDVSAGSAP
jgi:diguanylate cyclase (GGDEF)-like protein